MTSQTSQPGPSAVEGNPQTEPRLGRSVSIDQAALLLKVSRRTVYYRIRDGQLRTIRTLGRSQRVLLESMAEFLPAPVPVPAFEPAEGSALGIPAALPDGYVHTADPR